MFSSILFSWALSRTFVMYREHQAIIAAWAARRSENLARVLQFCIVSQRRKFFNVPADMETAILGLPEVPGVLYGWRARAWDEVWERREDTAWHCRDILSHGLGRRARADCLLAYISGFYGLNVAKAGFACQLAFGVSGCLDTVNVARLGLPAAYCKGFSTLRTPRGRWRRVARYNATVYRHGGPARLWDDWCRAVADRYPGRFPAAWDVSAYHLECLGV